MRDWSRALPAKPGMTGAPVSGMWCPGPPRGATSRPMAVVRRNLSLAALMLALVALAGVLSSSALWACVAATLLGLAGVVLFRGNAWRTGALLTAALALSLAL